MTPSPSGWRSRLSGAAFTLLASAVAIYFAMRLVEAVWPVLVGVVVVVAIGYVAWVMHRRRDGW